MIYLHEHPEFEDLIRTVSDEMDILPELVEKDYWIMHCLHGLQQQYTFYLKGGTSLSKGFGLIERFSEDIDIYIEPPPHLNVKIGKNHDKPAHRESRKAFYDFLKVDIAVAGIVSVERDTEFDDSRSYRSGGLRLSYGSRFQGPTTLKEGILLEVGFDQVIPHQERNISSWVFDRGRPALGDAISDNRAIGVRCYHPGYTLVEKLQTISTKHRNRQDGQELPTNFLRHYYDVYQLLQSDEVRAFIGTPEYFEHKTSRFRTGDNPDLTTNVAFNLNAATIEDYGQRMSQSSLYYRESPAFQDMLENIQRFASTL